MSINIKFPFENDINGNVFGVNNTTESAIKDDLISLLTTKRGQRVMNNRLYSPIYDYIHEQLDDVTIKELENEIKNKISEFLPQIEVKKIIFVKKSEENLLNIKITFLITELFRTEQTIEMNIPIDETDL